MEFLKLIFININLRDYLALKVSKYYESSNKLVNNIFVLYLAYDCD